MFRKQPIKNSSPLSLNIESLPDFLVELDTQSQELILGGSFTGEDRLRSRLTSLNAPQNQRTATYGIQSIPTLIVNCSDLTLAYSPLSVLPQLGVFA